MPIGNVSRDSGPKRPPWVKDKNTEEPPSWTQRRLKPVDSKAGGEDETAAIAKPLKPSLKKQSTIREKTENGVLDAAVDKTKPSSTKASERSKTGEEKISKFAKSALKSIETIPKLEDKLPKLDEAKGKESKDNIVEKTAPKEKPSLKSVRTIDDKVKEKSVTIVDKRERSSPAKLNNTTNEKPLNKVNSIISDKDKPKTNGTANEKPAVKPDSAKPNPKTETTKEREVPKRSTAFQRSSLKKVDVNDKPNNTNKTIEKETEKPASKVLINEKVSEKESEKPASKVLINEKVPTKSVAADKESNNKKVTNSVNNNTEEKEPSLPFKVKLKPVAPKPEKPKEDEKEEEKPKEEMATKPPKPIEKTPSKLPPRKPSLVKQPSKDDVGTVKKWRDPLHERVKENIDKTLANEIPKGHTLTKNESLRSLLKPTPPPMPPPLPPKMPPPPEFKRPPPDPTKLKRIEQLRSRPRRRPDWSDMMKEVEQGKKLKHVECNDRSSPIITRAAVVKNKDQFIFESEKPNSHNELLKEINKGVRLKKTKTNDRSKPNLEGLRKFRRQMTIEEQVQKSMSQANLAASPSGIALADVPAAPEEDEIDEMDDIDKVRDDLQSTKQLLAIELRNKEAQERENKRLLTRIQNLEAELARERAIIKQEQHKTVISVTDAYDERLVNNLKAEVEKTKENADSLEKQYLDAAEQRDTALTEVEELKRKNAELEKKLEQALANQLDDIYISEEPLSFYQKRQLDFEKQCRLLNIDINSDEAHHLRKSAANNNLAYTNATAAYNNRTYDEGIMPTNAGSRRSSHAIRQLSVTKDDSFEEELESEPEEEESEEKKQKRMEKEVRNMKNKIRHLKEKQENMKRERVGYKMMLKNTQAALKDEKKKYKELKREVDKMAAMMKEVGSDDDEDEEEEEEESEESKKSESEEESESETEADTESETESESEPEDAPLPKKKDNLTKRLKRHEQRVNALKKGNALLQANVDRLKDDVLKQREESQTLKKELDSLIDDLE